MEKYVDQWATLGGHKIRYIEEGKHERTILLVHGLGCSALEWSENIKELSTHFRVIATDLVGFGMSDRPNSFEYTPARQAGILKELCTQIGVNKVNLVGNSYGGLVAMEFAKSNPEMTESIVLVNSAGAGFVAPLSMRISSLPLVGEMLVKKTRVTCKQGFEAIMYDRTKLDEERVDCNYAYWLPKGSKRAFIATVRGMMNLTGFKKSLIQSLHQFLDGARIKTLIIWGRHDPMLPLADAQMLQKLIKGSILKIFENAGHAPMFESPKLFNASLMSFLGVQVQGDSLL